MNKYLFVIDKDGNRITSLLDGLHGNGEKELIERAKKEFPNAQYVYSDEDMQQEFYAGKVYIAGKMQDAPEVLPSLDELKTAKITQAGELFATIRDAIRWVECSTSKYGFDCATEDIVNFMSAYTPMLITGTGTVMYKVWFDTLNKGLVELTSEDMTKVYEAVRTGQLEAYVWYETIKAQINACTTTDEVNAIDIK